MTPTTTPAQPAQGYEHDRAIMEGERNASLAAFNHDCRLSRDEEALYEAGFTSGWDRHAAQVAALTAAPGVRPSSGRLCYVCGHPAESHPWEADPRGGKRRGNCPTAPAQPAEGALHQHLLDLLGAKDHEDAARIIAGHHARELAHTTQPAEGAAYAELPEPALSDDLYCEEMMRDFADRTHALRASHGQAPADPDGEAFRTAAHLGLTLRFYGGCAQSSMPGTPSAYVVVTCRDRAAGMREAVQRAATVIENGGESQRLDTTTAQPAPAAGAVAMPEGWHLIDRGDEVSLKGPDGQSWRYRSTHGTGTDSDFIYRFLRSMLAAAPTPAVQGDALLKQSLWLASSFYIHRYLMSNADGRWDGAEKATRHDELCRLYVAVFRGCEVDMARRDWTEDWEAVHDATQALTDNLDDVIGFPLKGRPDYNDLAPKFFDHFHRLATGALTERAILAQKEGTHGN